MITGNLSGTSHIGGDELTMRGEGSYLQHCPIHLFQFQHLKQCHFSLQYRPIVKELMNKGLVLTQRFQATLCSAKGAEIGGRVRAQAGQREILTVVHEQEKSELTAFSQESI